MASLEELERSELGTGSGDGVVVSGLEPLAHSAKEPACAKAASGPPAVPKAKSGAAVNSLSTRITALKAEQKAQREERARVAKELRNEERKRKRLRARAKLMTDEDLMAVIGLRAETRTARSSSSAATASTDPIPAAPAINEDPNLDIFGELEASQMP